MADTSSWHSVGPPAVYFFCEVSCSWSLACRLLDTWKQPLFGLGTDENMETSDFPMDLYLYLFASPSLEKILFWQVVFRVGDSNPVRYSFKGLVVWPGNNASSPGSSHGHVFFDPGNTERRNAINIGIEASIAACDTLKQQLQNQPEAEMILMIHN